MPKKRTIYIPECHNDSKKFTTTSNEKYIWVCMIANCEEDDDLSCWFTITNEDKTLMLDSYIQPVCWLHENCIWKAIIKVEPNTTYWCESYGWGDVAGGDSDAVVYSIYENEFTVSPTDSKRAISGTLKSEYFPDYWKAQGNNTVDGDIMTSVIGPYGDWREASIYIFDNTDFIPYDDDI